MAFIQQVFAKSSSHIAYNAADPDLPQLIQTASNPLLPGQITRVLEKAVKPVDDLKGSEFGWWVKER